VQIEWSGVDGVARRGEVWCPGPSADSVWVITDEPSEGEGRAVCVGLDGQQTALQAQWSQQEHHDLVALKLPAAAMLSALTGRGGQLRARIHLHDLS